MVNPLHGSPEFVNLEKIGLAERARDSAVRRYCGLDRG